MTVWARLTLIGICVGLVALVSVSLSGSSLAASASATASETAGPTVTAAAADRLFEAHTAAFYQEKEGRAWFRESTEGGKVSFWMRAEQMEMVLDAYERTGQ